MVAGCQKTTRNFLDPHHQTKCSEATTIEKTSIIKDVVNMTMGEAMGGAQISLLYCMYDEKDIDHGTKYCPIYLESKRKMNQKSSEPPLAP
jgi:hypothetical protein